MAAVLVGVRVQVANDLTAGQIEQVCTEIEIEMLRRVTSTNGGR